MDAISDVGVDWAAGRQPERFLEYMVRRDCEKPRPLFLYGLDTIPRRNPPVLPFFRLSENLYHRPALEDPEHRDKHSHHATQSLSTDFVSFGWHRHVLSDAAFDLKYNCLAARGFYLRLQSISRRARDASCSCFIDRIHSLLCLHLSTGSRKEKLAISVFGDCVLCAQRLVMLVLPFLHSLFHRIPYLIHRYP